MKRIVTLLVFISLFFIQNRTVAQTYYYNATKTFNENGYTYQCDIATSNMVTLYNKSNQFTYTHMYYKGTDHTYNYDGSNDAFDTETWTRATCYSIVNNAFSNSEKGRVRRESFGITLIIDSNTGKVIEVNFNFHKTDKYATIPVSVYRKIETELKANIWVTPTAEGKKLNYLMLGWRHEVELPTLPD
ncbi:hypothetical protein FACS189426_13580 [Bacteroidia bacterium]|nr:hypothetical protein FACS189426_13580 [Bacteroidia bacterium]GHT84549.1 hypothetical protein FACS18947_2150 [Bacteroidia bacterium]GHV70459.1 hypothetical protein FACS189420_1640 [Bacteroidia bacterium]